MVKAIHTPQSDSALRVRDLMRINHRFRKSVQIELDLDDPHSTDGYITTDFIDMPDYGEGAAQFAH